MNQAAYYIRVGLALAVFGLVAGYSYFLLRGNLASRSSYAFDVVFNNARGITAGADATLSGVKIGSVEEVGLTPDNLARVRLRVQKKINNRAVTIPKDSKFVIAGSLLGGTPELKIVPGMAISSAIAADEPNLRGADSGLDGALAKAEQLSDSLNKIVSDAQTQKNLKQILVNIEQTTGALARALPTLSRQAQVQLAQVERLSTKAERTLNNIEAASQSAPRLARQTEQIAQNTQALTGDLRGTLAENRKGLRSLIRSAGDAASAFAGIGEQAQLTLGDPNLRQNLVVTTENLKNISAKMDKIAGDLEQLSGDSQLNADLRATVTNIRDTSESVKNLAERVSGIRLPGEKRPPGPPPTPTEQRARNRQASLLELGPALDSYYNAGDPRLRLDMNYALLSRRPDTFYRIGLYDFSERNRLNAQIGRTDILPGTAVRYGLVAGRLGLGVDWRVGPLDLRLDLYDPNHLTLNARAKARLRDDASALIGVDSIGRDGRAVLGIQIRP